MKNTHSINTNQRPALRLVSTKDLSRDEWLRVRRQGIGASDAAAAVGLSPWKSQLELWLEKTGRDAELPKPDPDDDGTPMFWGNVLEPIVAEQYSRRTGRKVRRVRSVLRHPDEDKSFMLANLDYAVVGDPDVHILECKTTGEFGAKHWKDGVPDFIQCQVQHQLAVTGKQAADVAVLIAGQKFQIHRIRRDDDIIGNLIELERRFWSYVESDTPPPADGSDSAGSALGCLFPRESVAEVDLSGNPELNSKFAELLSTRDEIDMLSQYEEVLKQGLQQHMGEAGKALFTQGYVTWKRSRDSLVLDTAALLKDQPDLLKQYPLVRPGSRRFIVKASSSN